MGIMAGEERGMTIGLHILVFDSFMSSIQNLFTKGNWGVLFTGYIMQNPPLPEGSLLWKLYLLKPRDLLLTPSVVLPLTVLCLSGRVVLYQMVCVSVPVVAFWKYRVEFLDSVNVYSHRWGWRKRI